MKEQKYYILSNGKGVYMPVDCTPQEDRAYMSRLHKVAKKLPASCRLSKLELTLTGIALLDPEIIPALPLSLRTKIQHVLPKIK